MRGYAWGFRSHLILVTLIAALATGATARADEGFRRLFPFLVDLAGWTAEAPDGASLEIPGQSMTTASRKYERGEAQVEVQIMTGPAAQGALAATGGAMKFETRDASMSSDTVDGLQVTKTFDRRDRSGAVMVVLSQNALFVLQHNGIAEDEAWTLARKFDWKAMQGALPK